MKKVLSLVLAIAMVLSSMSFAFAGTFEDVEDAAVAKAVDALSSLGVVNGYEDGTYKPGNGVTRAEMVKLLVVALGHEDLAADSKSAFSDAQGKWYDGYAAVAQALGITNGTGAGKFSGENQIKFTEVITMIMRALGYNDRAVNANRENVYNATSYKTTAARLNILKGVTFNSNTANRGEVAVMLYNALEVQVVVPDEDGYPIKQWIVVPAVGEIGVARTLLDDVATRQTVTIGTGDLFGVHPIDVSAYLGEEVIVYTNDDDEILFVKSSIDAAKDRVKAGTVAYGATADAASGTVTLKFGSSASTHRTFTPATSTLIVNSVVRNDLNETQIANIINSNFHTAKYVAASGTTGDKTVLVIEDINNTILANDTYISGKTKYQGFTLPTKADGTVNFDKVVVTGDATSLDEIEVNDVLQVCTASGNIKFYVTRNTIEGTVTAVDTFNGTYFVDETEYELNATGNAETSLALGLEGTFFLDKDGNIAFANAKVSTSNYGVITAYNPGTLGQSFGTFAVTKAPQVKMVGADGKEKAYDVVVKASQTSTVTSANGFKVTYAISGSTGTVAIESEVGRAIENTTGAIGVEVLVKYTLNEDGKITSISNVSLSGLVSGTKEDAKFLADNNTIVLGRADDGTYSLVDLEKLTNGSIKYQVLTNTSNFRWDYVIVTEGINSTSNIKTYAVIKSISQVYNTSNSEVQKITAYVDGVKVSYLTNASSTFVETDMDKVIALVFNSNGVVTGTTAPDPLYLSNVTASAINSDNSVIKVTTASGDAYHTLASDVVVYKVNSNGTMSVADLNDIRVANGTAQIELYAKSTTDNVVNVIVIK